MNILNRNNRHSEDREIVEFNTEHDVIEKIGMSSATSSFFLGMCVWTFGIGIILWTVTDMFVYDMNFSSTISYFFSASGLLGYFLDFQTIEQNEVASVYDSLNRKLLYNVSGGRYWKRLFTHKIAEIYDFTEESCSYELTGVPTKDKNPRQFVNFVLDYFYRIVDPLALENASGVDDVASLVEKFFRDQAQAWGRTKTLFDLENQANFYVDENFLLKLYAFLKKYGIMLILRNDDGVLVKPIRKDDKISLVCYHNDDIEYEIDQLSVGVQIRNIQSTSEDKRKELADEFFEQRKRAKQEEGTALLVERRYLTLLCAEIEGRTIQFFNDKAIEQLRSEIRKKYEDKGYSNEKISELMQDVKLNRFTVANTATNLAQAEVDKERWKPLRSEARREITQGQNIVPESRIVYEGLEGADSMVKNGVIQNQNSKGK